MSGIAKAIKKVFKSDVFKVIVVAAAVWFTAGTASAYFAAPEAGLGSAMSQSASTMWSQTTTFFGATAPVESAAVESAANVVATPLAEAGASAAVPIGEQAGTAFGESLVEHGAEMAAESSTFAANTAAVAPAAVAPAAAAVAPAAAAETGMLSWLKANPMATMMLGQGAAGAYGGYLEDKQAEREAEERKNRGLMGYDSEGNYAGRKPSTESLLASPSAPAAQAPAQSATTAPIVASQQVAPQTVQSQQPQQVSVPRDELTKLIQQGQNAQRG